MLTALTMATVASNGWAPRAEAVIFHFGRLILGFMWDTTSLVGKRYLLGPDVEPMTDLIYTSLLS